MAQMSENALDSIHPGEVLQQEFLAPMGITPGKIAKEMMIPLRKINEIVKGQQPITRNVAIVLGKFLVIPKSSGSTCRNSMIGR